MKTVSYVIQDTLGLHARPAGQLVKEGGRYKSKITLKMGEQSVRCNRLIALMGMQIKQGDEIQLTAEGEDEAQACEGLLQFLQDNRV